MPVVINEFEVQPETGTDAPPPAKRTQEPPPPQEPEWERRLQKKWERQERLRAH